MRVRIAALSTLAVLIVQDFGIKASAYSSVAPPSSGVDVSRFVVGASAATREENAIVAQQLPSLGQRLADVQGHWARAFIEPLVSLGILQGFSDGNFRPDAPMNRAQFATLVAQIFQKNPIRNAAQFADVPRDYWAYNAIQAAYQMGFLGGDANNNFNPNKNISRVEVLVALVQGLNLQATAVNPAGLENYFEDAASIPAYARNSVAAAVESRLVVNYPNVRAFNPNREATRAEVAAFLHQALVRVGKLPPLQPGAIANRPQNPPAAPPEQFSPTSIPVPPPPGGFNQASAPPPGFNLKPTISVLEAQEADYTLGAGDRVRLDIINVPEYSGEYQILVNGSVNLPLIGNVAVKGMTLEEASRVISARYSRLIKEPISTVSLVAPRPLKVAIAGEVNRPGSYTIPLTAGVDGKGGIQFPTVTQALQLAGGISQTANLRQVLVRRPQLGAADQIIGIDLWALLQGGDLRQDLTLQDGDTIFIQTSAAPNLAEAPALASASFSAPKSQPLNIAVVGEVAKPGAYTVTVSDAGERPTVTRAIKQAGGLTQSADIRRVIIRRPTQSGSEQLIAADLWQLLNAGDLQQDIILQQGDTILIPTATRFNVAEGTQLAATNLAADLTQPLNIAVVGEVNRPGSHTVKADKPGELPTVTRAIQQAGGITQLANIRQIQVRRLTRDGSEKTIDVDLWQLLQGGDLRQDAILQPGDTILIPTATALNPEEATELAAASFSPGEMTVNVVGEVTRPGAVKLPPNTPLNQALLAAGGFNNRARKGSVELIRLNANGTVSKRDVDIDFDKGISEENNPTLRANDVVVVRRSGLAQVTDTLGSVLTPVGGIFTLFNFFRIFQ